MIKYDVSLSFQDLYRILLEAESEGILEDVDMTKVEKLILDPKAEMKSVGTYPHGDVVEQKGSKTKAESEGISEDVDTTEVEKLILGPETDKKWRLTMTLDSEATLIL